MPILAPDQAKAIIRTAADAAAFAREAVKTDVNWWEATPQQRTELMGETAKPDVKEAVGGYCKQLTESFCRTFLQSKVIPQDKVGRAYWLQEYLFESSRSSTLSPLDKKKLVEGMNRLLYRPGGVGSEALKVPLDEYPADKLRKVLTLFLEAGFLKVPTTDADLLAENFDDLVRASMKVYTGPKQYKMRWRSDSRAYPDIESAGGFLAKARSAEGYAASLGMRQPWHPFSDPALRKYMWFRKGQGDNCLNSVVSVGRAKEWQAYLPFPLMKDYPTKLQKRRVLVTTAANRRVPVTLGVSHTWLYLFVMTDLLALKTGALGARFGDKAFPEIGVGSIPIGNVYGAVRFVRVFHAPFPAALNGPAGEHLDAVGFTAYPVEAIAPPKTRFAYSALVPQPPGVADVRRAFNAVLHAGPVHVKWTSSGFAEVPATFAIDGTEVKLSPEDLKSL